MAKWHAINILITKPHVVNKRLWGSIILKRYQCKHRDTSTLEKPPRIQGEITEQNVENMLKTYLNLLNFEPLEYDDSRQLEIIFSELLPKTVCEYQILQMIVINKPDSVVNFYNITQESYGQNVCPDFSYQFQINDNNQIFLKTNCEPTDKSHVWLTNTVLPQLSKWSKECGSSLNHSLCTESLALVSHKQYYLKYNELKEKYGKELVKIWPECTDPSKFVYEDVAIATYLLLLWKNESNSKQTFVDLGCGNGLLVYILTKEGHSGVGIDVRKRNIWDMYGEEVVLQEKTIVPSDSSLFPDTDWLIGNHSDELTPWIPVIAAKSSYNCNFFVLPCCAYNFDGSKYQRKNAVKSQYTDYMEYIDNLGRECGFNVDMDRLKIPSTKRICLVGRGRKYHIDNHGNNCDMINKIINTDTSTNSNEEKWVSDFKPREAVEKVKNCTRINKSIVNSIVNSVTDYLLENLDTNSKWNGGKTVDLNELIKLITQDQLKELKSECGGLQTLLKNNHNIFKVQSGKVQLRYPKTVEEVNKNSKPGNVKIRQRPCWFYNSHPQGCPLKDVECSFLHIKSS